MIALIGAILGMLGGIIPEFFKLTQNKRDQAHELAMMALQLKGKNREHLYKMEEIDAGFYAAEQADLGDRGEIHSGVKWIDGLNASVRPVIAYAFFLLYGGVKVHHILNGLPWHAWTEFDDAAFSAVMSFYFGSRAFSKAMGRTR